MTIRKLILTGCCVLGLQIGLGAQVGKASAEELKRFEKRTLVVAFMDTIAIKPGKKSASKRAAYNKGVHQYNALIQKALTTESWTHNPAIEFKTIKEISKIRSKTRSLILFVSFSQKWKASAMDRDKGLGLRIETWNIMPAEKFKADMTEVGRRFVAPYSFFIPRGFSTSKDKWQEAQLKLAVKMMDYHLSSTKRSGKKVVPYVKYAAKQCKRTGSLHILRSDLHKGTKIATAKKFYSGLKVEKKEDYVQLLSKEESLRVVVYIPYGIASSQVGVVAAAQIQYAKVVVDLETGEPYFAYGTKTGEMFDNKLRKGFFKKLARCK